MTAMASLLPGLVYTDESHRVVFANLQFLKIMNYSREQHLKGMTLDEVLGLNRDSLDELLSSAQETGGQFYTALRVADARAGEVICVGEIAQDAQGRFLGLNIMIGENAEEEQAEVASVNAQLAAYFMAQVDYLRIQMSRMAGKWVEEKFETLLKQSAWQRRAMIFISPDGRLEIEDDIEQLSPLVYKEILQELVNYAIQVVGAALTRRILTSNEGRLDAVIVSCAEEAGIRGVLGLPKLAS